MTTRSSGKQVKRSATTGRIVKTPLRSGTVSSVRVERAVKKVASSRVSSPRSQSLDSVRTKK